MATLLRHVRGTCIVGRVKSPISPHVCAHCVPVLSAVPNQQNLFPNPAKIADVLRYSISRKYGLNLTLTLALTLALTLTLSNCHMSRNSYYILYKILLMSPSYSLGCVSSV